SADAAHRRTTVARLAGGRRVGSFFGRRDAGYTIGRASMRALLVPRWPAFGAGARRGGDDWWRSDTSTASHQRRLGDKGGRSRRGVISADVPGDEPHAATRNRKRKPRG